MWYNIVVMVVASWITAGSNAARIALQDDDKYRILITGKKQKTGYQISKNGEHSNGRKRED